MKIDNVKATPMYNKSSKIIYLLNVLKAVPVTLNDKLNMLTINDSASFPTEESQNKLNSALIPHTTVTTTLG